MTTGYQAAIESNTVQLSYGPEATWGTAPATAFQAIRMTSETLAGSKTRQRPSEINTTREATQSVTTQETASGTINVALSYGTYDDMLSVLLGADWQDPISIAGVSGDIVLTNVDDTHATISSATSDKFADISVGQWFRTLGFTNAANNDIWRCTAKADDDHVTAVKIGVGAPVTETPAGTAAQIRACMIRNGTQFKSLFFQKKLATALWLRYPGSFVTQGTISGGVGQFLSGSFNVTAQQELTATTDASTGGVTAAPGGGVHDPVGGFVGVFSEEALLSSGVDSFSIQMDNTGAAAEYAMGSKAAQGMLMGTMTVSGTVKIFFRDFSLYNRFVNEAQGPLSFVTKDPAGNAYVITVLNAALVNPNAGDPGPNQAMMQSFTLEGNPLAAGGTIQIDKLPAT